MIIARSPLRISLGGGGTDLPSYYRAHGGFVLSAAITQYVYVTMQRTPLKEIMLRYSQIERVKTIDGDQNIDHPRGAEVDRIAGPNIEITSMADIPAGTGLGSSGSFATACSRRSTRTSGNFIHPRELAEMACHIELDILKEPIGKQDQYIAAYGGVTAFEFRQRREVEGKVAQRQRRDDRSPRGQPGHGVDRLLSSGVVGAQEQDDRSKKNDQEMIDNLHRVRELGYRSPEAIETGNLAASARSCTSTGCTRRSARRR